MDPELQKDLRREHFALGYPPPQTAAQIAQTYETNEKTRQRVVAEAVQERRKSILETLQHEQQRRREAAARAESGGDGGEGGVGPASVVTPQATIDPDLLLIRRDKELAEKLKKELQRSSFQIGDDPLYL